MRHAQKRREESQRGGYGGEAEEQSKKGEGEDELGEATELAEAILGEIAALHGAPDGGVGSAREVGGRVDGRGADSDGAAVEGTTAGTRACCPLCAPVAAEGGAAGGGVGQDDALAVCTGAVSVLLFDEADVAGRHE